MKFVHISDLHIGKIVHQLSMIEDQKYILRQIMNIIDDEKPDAVFISGDIYDRGVPPAEAVALLDDFLVSLSNVTSAGGDRTHTFIIYGNHDSPERLSFANDLIAKSGIHISPVYNGTVEPFEINDEYGKVLIYMLPFIKPAHVRNVLAQLTNSNDEADTIETYTDAVNKAIEMMNVDKNSRSVILSHQYITGADTCDSETKNIGGLDNVDASVYRDFNYVALGHLHRPQNVESVGGNTNVICYSGTPLKYSFSETESKSVVVGNIDGEGAVTITRRALTPIRDMRTVTGTYEEIKAMDDKNDDYIRAAITDTNIPARCYSEIRSLYRNFMTFADSSQRVAARENESEPATAARVQSPYEIFNEFFMIRNDRFPNDDEAEYIRSIMEELRDEIILGEKEMTDNAAD